MADAMLSEDLIRLLPPYPGRLAFCFRLPHWMRGWRLVRTIGGGCGSLRLAEGVGRAIGGRAALEALRLAGLRQKRRRALPGAIDGAELPALDGALLVGALFSPSLLVSWGASALGFWAGESSLFDGADCLGTSLFKFSEARWNLSRINSTTTWAIRLSLEKTKAL